MAQRSLGSPRLASWPDGEIAWVEVEQRFERRALAEPAKTLLAGLDLVRSRVSPGDRVAVAVGSRGISCLEEITRSLVGWLRSCGAEPFVVPAMGSHGGADADGQVRVLAALGITEASIGAPILSAMDTVLLGRTPAGIPVHTDRRALEADLVVPVARVKPHTDFRGPIESGPTKMLAIGLGKQRGAEAIHAVGLPRLSQTIAETGAVVLEHLRVPFCVAVVEDAYDAAAIVEVVPAEQLVSREPELLVTARQWMPSLPAGELEILVVQEMGKDISGDGMDPNITGRFYLPEMSGEPDVQRLVLLDLTAATHGNATGIGMADIVTRRAADKVDWFQTYTNEVTAHTPHGARLPLVALDDEEAFAVALRTLTAGARSGVRLAWIRNTLSLSRLMVTLPVLESLREGADVQPVSDPVPIAFEHGALVLGGG